ncbi:hypothetical protein [Alloyangia pacifica]|uniref:hypothetical protein n=1 Tax=Alloyangia pacifica TaxID=311180 RepID=UPI001CFE3EA7|nr:hypothetical protein [Alloyangia pacifica]
MVVSYQGLEQVVDVPGWYLEGDGDAIYTGADLDEEEAVFLDLKARAVAIAAAR